MKDICVQAYEHMTYYKMIFDEVRFNSYNFSAFEDFNSNVPVLNKQMVIDHMDEVVRCINRF